MEFGHLDNAQLQKLYDLYSYAIIPPLGQYVTGDRDSYQYLVESIRAFPQREELCTRLRDAGFDMARATPLTFGIVNIHEAWKY